MVQKNGSFGFDHTPDNIISSVHPGGPAEHSGKIMAGDKILTVNGEDISYKRVTHVVKKLGGDCVKLHILQKGNNVKLSLSPIQILKIFYKDFKIFNLT